MARPAKDDVARKRPMSFTMDEDNLILWGLLECSRSNFIATMLQYVVKDEKLRDIFYGSNGASALKAFELIEQRKERKRQELLEKASGGTYLVEQVTKEPEAINKPKGEYIVEDKLSEVIDEPKSKDTENNKKHRVIEKSKTKDDVVETKAEIASSQKIKVLKDDIYD